MLKSLIRVIFLFLLVPLDHLSVAQTRIAITAFKVEHLQNPIGIDVEHPRFSWVLSDDRSDAMQSAYQIKVSTDSLGLAKGIGELWDTGKWLSSQNRASYAGKLLKPFTKYYWRLDVWDRDGEKTSSTIISSFETGMMNERNWKGAWISDNQGIEVKPAAYFRKQFTSNKKIKSARAYIAVGGLYELYLNGEKVGNHRLDPAYTRFDRRNLYVSYDVTKQLKQGENAIGVLLGNGWYNHQSTAVWFFDKAPWRARPTFCLDLRITYEDGTIETIVTDKSWKTNLSPIVFNSIYTAEHYDARLEQPGWNRPDFDASKWKDIVHRAAPSQHIVSQMMHPIRNVEQIIAKSIHKINDTTYVFDLGRNISGVSEIKVKGKEGTVLRLKHGERLYENGHVDISNIDQHYRPKDDKDPFQTDIVILSGKGEDHFMPKFNYKGFQYVEVTSSAPISLNKESLSGYFMHSDVPVKGNIHSSNPLINKIWEATNSAYLSNLFGYPTDCPQREKNGWTGDAHIAIETGLYNFDGITIYEKWLADHRDEQQPNGVLPSIIPTSGWGYEWGNGPDWTSTIALIPWNIYLFYGDSTLLRHSYLPLKQYVDYIDRLYPDGLTTWGLGDWVPVKSKSPVELSSSIYYYVDALILAKAAKLFGKEGDYDTYSQLANKIKEAINRKYLNTETGIYGQGLQTELSMPLYWGVVPEELKAKVAKNLADRVAADDFRLDVGLLGTKSVLNALSENGYADIAYKLASRDDYPSWGWWIRNGATTLYENWDIGSASDISMNHIMFGEIGAWLYKGIGGIKPDPDHPGFEHILLEPNFVTGLDTFEASHVGPQGEIKTAWARKGKKVLLQIKVPANSRATLKLPENDGRKLYEGKRSLGVDNQQLVAGTYEFEWR
ncbi:alpha-L-rhamnosidase [Olivibacter sitiensis]|uniref:alpha-L-rhamnosidase n=1 Tax=Olivibacter sitiensis TaxID=376470 RepID=UPI0004121881|nr:alpha-L-rhamnosidase [Olivibacter sitiensis]